MMKNNKKYFEKERICFMRKALSVLLSVACILSSVSVYATFSVETVDLKNDIVRISGDAPEDKVVTIAILKPGINTVLNL
jgi:hypothetical protein